MKVAFVCEDPIYDQYIAGPVVKEALRQLGKPHADVRPILTPKTRGFSTVLKHACEILDRYSPIVAAVVFVIDLDCDDGSPGRGDKVQALKGVIAGCDDSSKAVVVAARQELEVWALWGVRGDLPPWQDVRAHCDPKEPFFNPLLTKADAERPDGGRSRLIAASLNEGWQSLSTGCSELEELQNELRDLVV